MRSALLVGLAACGSAGSARVSDAKPTGSASVSADAGVPSIAAPRLDATGIDANACPLVPLPAKVAPAIHTAKRLRDVMQALVKTRQPEGYGPPVELPDEPGYGAFGVVLQLGHFKDSTSVRRTHHTIFGLPTGRFVFTGTLVTSNSMIPPPCGPEVQSTVIAQRVVDGPSGRKYGHVRVRRRDVDDKPTQPSVLARPSHHGPGCEELAAFRIEDHVIDLAAAEHVGGVAQTYRAPLYEEVDAPVVALDKLSVDARGIVIDDPRCRAFALRQ